VTSTPSDEQKLAGYADDLIMGLAQHLPGWVERTVGERLVGTEVDVAELDADIDGAVQKVTVLLRTDIDEQDNNPLAVVRTLIGPMTRYLAERSAEAVTRDPDSQRLFPDDRFDLTPGSFSDVHPDLHMAGLSWGAAKAHVHLQRRRAEGMIR
jgi:hypothetical protein